MAHSATAVSRSVAYSNWYKTPSPIGEAVYDALKLTVDYYVDPTKSTNGTGTALDPYQPSQAMGVSAGTVCLWTAGTYVGSDPGAGGENFRTPDLNPTNSGTSGNPIVHIADKAACYYTSGVTELRSGATVAASGWPAFGVNGQDYVYWYGFKTDGDDTNNKAGDDAGLTVLFTAHYCRIAYCDIDGDSTHPINNYSGIRIEVADYSATYNNKIDGFDAQGANHAGIIIYKSKAGKSYNNEIANSLSGYQVKGASGSTIIQGWEIYANIFHDNTYMFRLHGPVKGPSDELTLIYQNIGYACDHIAEFTSSGTHVGEQDGLRIFNNSFYNLVGSDPAAWWINHTYEASGDVPRDNIQFNNIISGSGSYWGSYGAGKDLEWIREFMQAKRNVLHNITQMFNGTGGEPLDTSTLADYQGSPHLQDVDSITSDPLFRNPAANNFRLQSGSPALTLGRDDLGKFGSVGATIPCGAYLTSDDYIGVAQ